MKELIEINEPIHVLKAGWRLGEISYPYLSVLTESSDEIQELPLTVNRNLDVSQSDQRFCIGFEPHRGVWNRCPHKNVLHEKSQLQCHSCAQDDFFSCRITCQGQQCRPKSLEAKALCDINETVLYLTYVGGYFKVGVSLNPMRRWIEQGSLFSMRLWKGNGLTVRFFEQQLGKLGLRLSVQRRSKLAQIGTKINKISIYSQFGTFLDQISKLNLFPLDNSQEIIELIPYYGNIPKLNRKPILDNERIKGRIVGVQGRLMILQDKNSYYAVDLTKLQGSILNSKSRQKQKPRQRTLFDY